MSYRSLDREWMDLPAEGFAGDAPAFPLPQGEPELASAEDDLWWLLWRKPQAAAWHALGLDLQVASYVRAFLESNVPGASAGLKTAVLRMETELGLSVAGMRQNLWKIGNGTADSGPADPSARAKSSRKDGNVSWLAGVTVEGA